MKRMSGKVIACMEQMLTGIEKRFNADGYFGPMNDYDISKFELVGQTRYLD